MLPKRCEQCKELLEVFSSALNLSWHVRMGVCPLPPWSLWYVKVSAQSPRGNHLREPEHEDGETNMQKSWACDDIIGSLNRKLP